MIHRTELDGVRGIAIALVVVAHALAPTTLFPGGGVIGVQLFFVLSGFLITSILATEWSATGRLGIRRFYGRRARRLVPALGLFLIAYLVWTIAAGESRIPEMLLAASYVSNWARVGGVNLAELNHTWSLAVEEQFYIVWPAVLLVLLRVGRKPALIVVGVAVGLTIWRVVLASSEWGRIYYATDTNAAALLAGASLALVGVPAVRHGRVLGLVALAVLLGLSLTMSGRTEAAREALILFGFPAATLASTALLIAAMNAGSRWLTLRPLIFLGFISYGLYLWHTGLDQLLNVEYGWGIGPRLIAIPVAIVIAWASRRFFESRFQRRRTDAQAPSASVVTVPAIRGPVAELEPLSPS